MNDFNINTSNRSAIRSWLIRTCNFASTLTRQRVNKKRGGNMFLVFLFASFCTTSISAQTWTVGYSAGTYGSFDLGQTAFDAKFAESEVFRRLCSSCGPSHQEVYYKRISPIGGFSAYSNAILSWNNIENVLDSDFELYSTYADLQNETNKWTDCNYSNSTVAFPRDCGPTQLVSFQWNSLTGGQPNYQFEILDASCSDDNTYSGTDGDWENPTNWSEACVPESPYTGDITIASGTLDNATIGAFETTGDFAIGTAAIFTNTSGITAASVTNAGIYSGGGDIDGNFTNTGTINL